MKLMAALLLLAGLTTVAAAQVGKCQYTTCTTAGGITTCVCY